MGFARSNLLPYLSSLGMSISMKNKKLIPVLYVILLALVKAQKVFGSCGLNNTFVWK